MPSPHEHTPAFDAAEMLRAAAAGDPDAWRRLVDLYARRVYALARSRLGRIGRDEGSQGGVGGRGGSDIAEEITQSVFVTLAAQLSSGSYHEQGRFESWLFRIAMNRIRDEVRRRKRQAQPTDPAALSLSVAAKEPEQGADSDLLDSLRGAMHQLNDADREIIELRHHAGMSFSEIAGVLEEPLGTVLARHHRALRKLKDCIPASLHPGSTDRDLEPAPIALKFRSTGAKS